MTDPTPPAAPNGNAAARRRGLQLLALAVVLGSVGFAAYWLLELRHYESTDDAYVGGDVVQITSEVAGTVTAVRVDDTQAVARGEVLVELDPADADVARGAAEAELARAVRDVAALYAEQAALRAELAARGSALARGTLDLERREPLVADGAVAGEELAHAHAGVEELRAEVAAARARLEVLAAQTRGTSLGDHPRVLAAAAHLRDVALAARRTRLRAPVAGVVAKRSVQIGQRVAPGTPLLAVVPLQDVWIDANVKEGQLGRIRVGQPVSVHSDLYGSGVELHGRVAGLAAGSGSAFALLPPQNASGNWIKIVQRVPVRITLDPADVAAHPLRIGLSAVVRIDVAERSGAPVATALRAAAAPASLAPAADPEVEARIASIVASNGGALAGGGKRSAP